MLKKLLFCGLMVSLVLGVSYLGLKQEAVKADPGNPPLELDNKEKNINLEPRKDFWENDPPGVPEQSRQRRQGTRRTTSTAQKPIPKTEAEKKIQEVIDDIYQNQSRGAMIVPATDGRMLRIMAEAVNAQRVVELGTSVGCSGLWFSMALQNTGGELITYEIDRRRAETARQNFKQAGVEDIVTLVEGDAHREITKLKDPIDVIFIDADKEGYLDYFNKLHSLLRPGGLILAHNVGTGGGGSRDFVNAVTTSADFDTAFFQLGSGLSITLKKRALKEAPKEQELKFIREPDVIFVPTPQDVVDKMLELAQVKKDDLVYDLGCGDGRIVVSAAKLGCTAFGYDINPDRVREARENVRKNNVGHLATIEQKDIFTLDLSKANVVTLYLLPSLNVKLIPQLEKLKPGSRIVSHAFDMRGVKPDQVVKVPSEDGFSERTVYLWTTPLKKIKEAETAPRR